MIILYPTKYIVLDFETSGLDPTKDKVIEFALLLSNEEKPISHLIKWPNFCISNNTTEITGITQDMIDMDGISPKEALNKIIETINTMTIIGHNIHNFDMKFLLMWIQNTLSLHSTMTYYERFKNNYVDTAALYRGWVLKNPQRYNENFIEFANRIFNTQKYSIKYNLAHCCNQLRVPIKETQHRASGDVIITKNLYNKLLAI
ncbi:MAG: 3'-5' exonuclease [Patescibacteria group bacterium]